MQWTVNENVKLPVHDGWNSRMNETTKERKKAKTVQCCLVDISYLYHHRNDMTTWNMRWAGAANLILRTAMREHAACTVIKSPRAANKPRQRSAWRQCDWPAHSAGSDRPFAANDGKQTVGRSKVTTRNWLTNHVACDDGSRGQLMTTRWRSTGSSFTCWRHWRSSHLHPLSRALSHF